MPASMEIGGEITKADLEFLLAAIESDGAGSEDGGSVDLDYVLDAIGKEPLKIADDDAAWGLFRRTEDFCFKHGLAFRRQSDSKYEYPGMIAWWRSGMTDPDWCKATNDGDPYITLATLRGILDTSSLKDVIEILERSEVPPVPPLMLKVIDAQFAEVPDA
jgi:hypothetical protein